MAYIGNAPTPIPLSTAQLQDGLVTTPKLATPIAPTISGGSIDGAEIGDTSPTTGKFTTLNATTGIAGGTF